MSERFGIPDHSPQHAPDHAQQNPTPTGGWNAGTGAGEDAPFTPATFGGGGGGTWSGPGVAGTYVARRPIWLGVVLTAVFGPLGLFYAGLLHGVAAMVFTWTVVSPLALRVSAASGGSIEPISLVYPVFWVTMIPWVVAAITRRNRKIDPGGTACS